MAASEMWEQGKASVQKRSEQMGPNQSKSEQKDIMAPKGKIPTPPGDSGAPVRARRRDGRQSVITYLSQFKAD
jgi:hypothetical protein